MADLPREPFVLPRPPHGHTPATIALIRLLFARGIEEAETAWYKSEMIVQARGRTTGRHWFEIIREGRTTYMMTDDFEGQYTSTKKPDEGDLSETGLIRINVTPQVQPWALRDYLNYLLDNLPPEDEKRLNPARIKKKVQKGVTALATMQLGEAFRSEYCGSALTHGPLGMGATKVTVPELVPPPEKVAGLWQQKIRQRYYEFDASAPVAAAMYLVFEILSQLAKPPADYVKALDDAPLSEVIPRALAPFLGHAETRELIFEACDTLDSEGADHISILNSCDHHSAFMAQTYLSVPCFMAAWSGCRQIASAISVTDAERTRATRLARGYEEELVRSWTALESDFDQWIDRVAPQNRREWIRRQRESGGAAAAEALWIDYSVQRRLFPPWWKPYFMGETDRITLEKPGG